MAITNNQIIMDATFSLVLEGKLGADEEIHTFARWKALGYTVKRGEHALIKLPIWKMSTKKNDDGEEVATGRMFPKTSAFFGTSQVEKLAGA